MNWLSADAAVSISDGPCVHKRWFANLLKDAITGELIDPSSEHDRNSSPDVLDTRVDAHTTATRAALDDLQDVVEEIVRRDVPGDLIDIGGGRGGTAILTRAVLRLIDARDRCVWVVDAVGAPPAAGPDQHGFEIRRGAVSPSPTVALKEIQASFREFGLLDTSVRFSDEVPDHQFALLNCRGHDYDTVAETLAKLCPLIRPGGFVVVGDYSIRACAQAVHDYRRENDIGGSISRASDGTQALWPVA